jgi:hypothetical protein
MQDKRCANLDINDRFDAVSDDFDATFFLAFVEYFELTLLLPVVHRADNDLRKWHGDLIFDTEMEIHSRQLRWRPQWRRLPPSRQADHCFP